MKKGIVGSKRPRVGQVTRPGQPTDFIALGSKQKQEHFRPHSTDNGSHSNKYYPLPPAKKIKVQAQETSHFHPITPHGRLAAEAQSRMSPTIPEPTGVCLDCPSVELVHQVMKHVDVYPSQAEAFLCGAIQSLRVNRIKPDHTTVLSLLTLAKQRPDIFNNKSVVESLASLLKKDIGLEYVKSKHNNIVAIIASSILMEVLDQEENWPLLIVRVFLDDSLGERIWVDHVHCQQFVHTIVAAYGTKPNPTLEGDVEMKEFPKEPPVLRFEDKVDSIHQITIELLRDRLTRRQGELGNTPGQAGGTPNAVGKTLIRTLTSVCGLQEVRLMSIQKLEMWLQNPKLIKPAQDLLLAICVNCNTHSQEDVDVIGHMTKMRLKSKLLLNHYTLCIKELIEAHPDNLKTMFSYVLYNELSNARNPSNMAVVVSTLQYYPESAAKTLASVCQDLLLQHEDYLRAVRGLLREIVRSVKHDMQFPALALGLMQEPDMEKFSALDQPHKDRFISSTCDLVCLTMLLSITPHAKEVIAYIIGKKKALEGQMSDAEIVYAQSKETLAKIQHNALWWAHAVVVPRLAPRISAQEFIQLLQKFLFLKPPDTYHTRDNWPPESERTSLVKMCHDCSVLEGSILRLAAIGLSTDHPLVPAEALDMIGQLVRRAGSIARPDFNSLITERSDVIDTILALCHYHHPGNIRLPEDYTPPSLAISQLYWSALQTLLIILAFNPSTVGHQAWTQYPMLKVFMEMSIVNRFSYPPVTVVDSDLRSQMTGKELQMSLVEKSEVLEFESHLAAATTRLVVTEETSLLLSQLIAMDPQGHPRRPPDRVLEQLSALSQRMQLGVLLCQSRQPDFLLEIINRHEENQSMTWLPELVASTKGQVGLLPVQCLCEFLLVQDSESEKLLSGGIHIDELVIQLRKIITSDNYEDSLQVVQYFLKRLSSPQKLTRSRSRYALSLVLSEINEGKEGLNSREKSENNFSWLLNDLPQLPHYMTVIRSHAIDAVRNAALVESFPSCIAAYVAYLCHDLTQYASDDVEIMESSSKAARMSAHLLIDRRTVVESALKLTRHQVSPSSSESTASSLMSALLQIFLTHVTIAMAHEAQRQAAAGEDGTNRMPWSDVQDEVYVRWPGQYKAATLHIIIPQASIVLLGYGAPSQLSFTSRDPRLPHVDLVYNELMGLWFTEEGYVLPQAFLMDTQEEALLLPDWLKLKMLRSKVTPLSQRLRFAAVRDLTVQQLVFFVQSFGVPVEAMDLLLRVLDSQCDLNREAILAATRGNTEYMSRLLDVQKLRGCKAGGNFAALLKSQLPDQGNQATKSIPSTSHDVIDLISDNDEAMDVSVPAPSGRRRGKDGIFAENIQSMERSLEMMFSSKGKSVVIWRELLQAFNQTKTGGDQNKPVLLCVQALHNLILTDFVTKLINFPSRATSLLRMVDRALRSCQRKFDQNIQNKFSQLVNIVSQNLGVEKKEGKVNPLYSFVTSWKPLSGSQRLGVQRSPSVENSENLRQSDWSKLEEFLRDQITLLDKDEGIKAKVGLVAQILLEEISHRRILVGRGRADTDDVCFTSIGTTGLLVDWLQLLDPELLAHSPTLQRKLLFESGKNDSAGSSLMFDQAYLLSLLAEHCNWETIHSAIKWLLSDATPDPTSRNTKSTIDPKTALDFLWVVIQTPKIWQGRENKSTSVNESVLSLTIDQFCRLITYMVATEASMKSDQSNSTTYLNLFSVYFSKFSQSASNVNHIVSFMLNKVKSDESIFTPIWWQLIAQMYVLQPHAEVWNNMVDPGTNIKDKKLSDPEIESLCDAVAMVNVGSNCRTDALVCSLLNRLGYVRSSASNDSQFGASMVLSSIDSAYDASLILMKIAGSRPLLVLRQLPLMSSMLRGRTRHEFSEFKVLHHLPLMLNTVILLRMTSPLLFRSSHNKHTTEIMTMFWQMLKQYCHRARRQMMTVLVKTLSLTHQYLNHQPTQAVALLSKHSQTLQSLIKTYHDQDHILPSLSSFQSAAMSSWTEGSSDAVRSFYIPHLLCPEQPISAYLELIGKNQDLENQLLVLHDFDESSKRKIDDVTPFLSDLRRIFCKGRDPVARKLALAATLRHARSHPETTRNKILEDFISCLKQHNKCLDKESDKVHLTTSFPNSVLSSISYENDVVARDVINFLPDLTVLCREEAPRILGAAFDAAVRDSSGAKSGDNIANKSESFIIARSMWLLCGLAETEMLPTAGPS
uniref:integrator complex subunit 1 n=1 Tax=Ciona intestinalis TaxID=7719 RepID=UPI000180BCD4|nr:integrator complex subunit 1 [Ciona intestinalis]|eukprot:XP_009861729.2 integrator complex subunit 1 [Ciona intestinalis]